MSRSPLGSARTLLAVAALLLPASATAHTTLVRSSPAARTVLAESPTHVQLWFAERLEAAYSSMSVWNGDGTRVDKQDVIIGPGDSKRLSVGVFTLRPGAYTVWYRVLSLDGHVLESSFVFTVSRHARR